MSWHQNPTLCKILQFLSSPFYCPFSLEKRDSSSECSIRKHFCSGIFFPRNFSPGIFLFWNFFPQEISTSNFPKNYEKNILFVELLPLLTSLRLTRLARLARLTNRLTGRFPEFIFPLFLPWDFFLRLSWEFSWEFSGIFLGLNQMWG